MQEMTVEEIHRRARKGPMLLLLRRGLSLIITLLSTVLIARILDPRQYGLAAMSMVVLSFVQVFRDFGLTNALLRKGVIHDLEVNFLFWFNLAATLTIAALIALAAPAIAAFYHEPIIAATLWVSLSGFIVSGASLQFAGVLKRDLRFDIIAGAETAGALVALISSTLR